MRNLPPLALVTLIAALTSATLYVRYLPMQRVARTYQQREGPPMHGYCLKCREKREMKDAQAVTLKNGRAARQGTCAVCGTKITVMGGAKAAAK